jgi:hypothetical protein
MEKSSPKILAASVIFKKNSTQRKQLPNMQKNRLILLSEQHLYTWIVRERLHITYIPTNGIMKMIAEIFYNKLTEQYWSQCLINWTNNLHKHLKKTQFKVDSCADNL